MTKARQIAMPMWLFALILLAGGCNSDNKPADLPGNATLGAEGSRKVHFEAPSSGTAYVYDNNNDHLLWSGPVHRGDSIDVDPDQDRIMVANQKVTSQTLARGRDHRIYFVPKSSASMDRDRSSDMSSDHVSGSVQSTRDRD